MGSSEICRRGFDKTLATASNGLNEEQNEFLLVHEQASFGHCGRECATASASCSALLDEVDDRDELAVALWRGETGNEAMVRTVCLDWAPRCRKKKKPLDKVFLALRKKDSHLSYLEQVLQFGQMRA